jgi:hypothetical protein
MSPRILAIVATAFASAWWRPNRLLARGDLRIHPSAELGQGPLAPVLQHSRPAGLLAEPSHRHTGRRRGGARRSIRAGRATTGHGRARRPGRRRLRNLRHPLAAIWASSIERRSETDVAQDRLAQGPRPGCVLRIDHRPGEGRWTHTGRLGLGPVEPLVTAVRHPSVHAISRPSSTRVITVMIRFAVCSPSPTSWDLPSRRSSWNDAIGPQRIATADVIDGVPHRDVCDGEVPSGSVGVGAVPDRGDFNDSASVVEVSVIWTRRDARLPDARAAA